MNCLKRIYRFQQPKYLRKYSDNKKVLGIETSCDETGAAVVDSNGNILGECINSQLQTHLANGGIIPTLARDLHEENIEKVVKTALERSKMTLNDIDAIATTVKPGIAISLAVGLNYTKKLIKESKIPFIPIHHMEAHALTARMVNRNLNFPFLVLLISGGHSQIAVAKSVSEFYLLGSTMDDAPGEAFDKIARRLKLRNDEKYRFMNGGQAIETMAISGDVDTFDIKPSLMHNRDCDFSFAGFKGRSDYFIKFEEEKYNVEPDGIIPSAADFCASLQHAMAKHIVMRVQRAMEFCKLNDLLQNKQILVVSGGVACNKYIRGALKVLCNQKDYELICPPPYLCTDNGIMIAWNGMERFKLGIGLSMDIDAMDIEPECSLGVDLREKVKKSNIKNEKIKLRSEEIRYLAYGSGINSVEHKSVKNIRYTPNFM